MCVAIRGFASSTFFDSFFTSNLQMCISQNNIYNAVTTSKIISEYLCTPSIEYSQPMLRSDHNIYSEDFVIVTVGARLQFDLDNDFVNHIKVLLEKNPGIRWILVGEPIGEYLLNECNELIDKKQLILWGFEKNLLGFYSMCNLYVNPNRKGGGISIRLAQEMGIPVLMNNFISDGLASVYSENIVEGNYDDLFYHIELLYNNNDMYISKKRQLQCFVNQSHEISTNKKIAGSVEKTISMFEGNEHCK